jgi:uncharacterized membrane protein (DUF4010 family)
VEQFLQTAHGDSQAFPVLLTALKLVISIAVGLLVGFEREWAQKDIGVRTFALTALLGTLAALLGITTTAGVLAGTLVLIALVNIRDLLNQRSLEATTSVALLTTLVLGILIGKGHLFTPVSAAILVTLLLSLKTQLQRFAGRVSGEEIRSFVLLALIGFVIWPLLPDRFVDPWGLLQPREAWVTVIVIAALGFLNYILLKLYGQRGVFATALLGGLVSSTAAGAELSTSLPRAGLTNWVGPSLLMTCISMFARNAVLLAIFAPETLKIAAPPLFAMALVSAIFAVRDRPKVQAEQHGVGIHLESPVSLRRVFSFGFVFVAIQALSVLGERALGSGGLFAVSVLGALISSATSTAAAANLTRHGQITLAQAGMVAVIASMVSAIADVPLAWKLVPDKSVARRLAWITVLRVVVGLAVMLAVWRFF